MKLLFAQLNKVDAESRRVYGRATQEVPDRAREIFDYESSKPLFEKWSSGLAEATKAAGQEPSLGNVRAMHGKVAAGKLVELTFNDVEKAIDVCAEIVDDNEWEKVLKGVYTGFSIGGDYARKWQDDSNPVLKRYTANPKEISLVDLACVPTANFACIKADGVSEDRPFARFGLLSESLAKADLKVGELLDLVQEYLPEDEIDALVKADSGTTDYFARLQALVAGEAEALEKSASDATGTPAAEETPASTESAPTNAEGDESAAADPKAVQKAAIVEKLKKGMWTLSSLADLLSTISYMAQDAEWEKKYEQDDSTVPADLRAWLTMGVELFRKMTVEETAELIASVTPPGEVVVEVLALAATGDLGKAGKRHSKADQDKVQAVHDHAVGLGATCDAAEKSAVGSFAKLDAGSALGKAVALVTGAAVGEDAVIDPALVESIGTFAMNKAAEVESLAKRVKNLEDMPALPKGTVRLVSKTADSDELNKVDEPAPDPKNPVSVMKAVHAGGGMRITL